MKRLFIQTAVILIMGAIASLSAFAQGVAPSRLIPEKDANAAGLTRAWYAQATLDRNIEEVSSATMQDGLLLVTTTDGNLQAFDAETGNTLWVVSVGDEYLLPPAANSQVVAAVCGTTLTIYERSSGKVLDRSELPGQPSSGPSLSDRNCFIPVFSRKILSYPIEKDKNELLTQDKTVESMKALIEDNKTAGSELLAKFDETTRKSEERYIIKPLNEMQPFQTATFGIAFMAPVIGTQTYPQDVLGWTTDEGALLLSNYQRNEGDTPFKLLYKLTARSNFSFIDERRLGNKAQVPSSDLASTPFFVPEDKSEQNMRVEADRRRGGMYIIGSRSGHVYALNDVVGQLRWMYLTDTPVNERISAFGDFAFIPTYNGDYFAVALRDGKEVWKATGVKRTVASSASCLYVIDSLDRLAVIDRSSGRRVATLDVNEPKFQVFNEWNDRVYLVTADGLVQCLREIRQETPVVHRESCQQVHDRLLAELNKTDPKAQSDASKPKTNAPAAPAPRPAPGAPGAPGAAASGGAPADDDPFGADAEEDPFGASADDADASSSDVEEDPFGAPADDADAASSDADDPFAGSEDEEDPFL